MSWASAIARLLALLQGLLNTYREYQARRDERARNELQTREKIDEKVRQAHDADRSEQPTDANIDDDDGFRRD